METKEMKNIKVPSYAKNFGDGKFCAAQPTYQCQRCGACAYTPNQPPVTFGGRCPNDNSGYHYWVKC